MKIQGKHRFAAEQTVVYELLLDPQALQASMPGCESLTPLSESMFELHMKVPVAAVKGEYTGTVEIVERESPNRLRLKIEVSGKTGFVSADAVMVLWPEGEATIVEYSAEAQVGGPAAGVGQRVIVGISRHQITTMMKSLERYSARPAESTASPIQADATLVPISSRAARTPEAYRRHGGLWRRLVTFMRRLSGRAA